MINKKFILNEALFEDATKFILDEDIILNEDVDTNSSMESIAKTIDATLTKLEQIKENGWVEALVKFLEDIKNSSAATLTNTPSTANTSNATFKTGADTWLNAFKALPAELTNRIAASNDINTLETGIKDLSDKTKAANATNDVQRIITRINNSFAVLKGMLNTASKELLNDNSTNSIKSLNLLQTDVLPAARQALETLANKNNASTLDALNSMPKDNSSEYNSYKQSICDFTNSLTGLANKVENLPGEINNLRKKIWSSGNDVVYNKKDVSLTEENCKSLSDTFTEITKRVGNLQQTTSTMTSIARKYGAVDGVKDVDHTDWEQRLVDAKDDSEQIKAIWNEYYKSEWGEHANEVQALGESFRQELRRLGFTERTNPFITYVKTLLENHIKINYTAYMAIHNAASRSLLNAKDVLGKGKLGFKNVIFNQGLLKTDENNIIAYLKQQQNVINFMNNSKEADFSQVQGGADTVAVNILYSEKSGRIQPELTKLNPNLTLSSLTFIRENLVSASDKFNVSVEKVKEPGDSSDSINKIMQKIDGPDKAKKVLKYLSMQANLRTEKNAAQINSILSEANVGNIAITTEEADEYKKIFTENNLSINASNVTRVMLGIATDNGKYSNSNKALIQDAEKAKQLK